MQVEQTQWSQPHGWTPAPLGKLGHSADLVLAFGSTACLENTSLLAELRAAYPRALLTGCSTAGEIFGTQVCDDSLVVTAITFEHTTVAGQLSAVNTAVDSYQCGQQLAGAIPHENLSHVFVLSDGLHVNGSQLVAGLTEHLPANVSVTGGLAGDSDRFEKTLLLWNGESRSHTAAIIGFYGERLKVGYGSLGGWEAFGPERLVTRAEENVLYEMDGKSALELYKQYLGEHADGLPATGLLFPLGLRSEGDKQEVVRTILSINEDEQSMTFAGEVPVGHHVRLMRASNNRLVNGASEAATTTYQAIGERQTELAILISCVGRKMVLKQRVEEETEAVQEILGNKAILTGFYSYGEISPFTPGGTCELHNQTMTITAFTEI
ncbi:MAG TPA: hypothetical protein ENH21_02560 [Chromatiales bacterium]|nr:hypothetical protein [Chromatiales bacterium]HEX22295.1 hypothetical protein [Chromatiales bacterium]